MDVRTLFAAQKYAASRPVTEPAATSGDAAQALGTIAKDFAATLQESEAVAMKSMTGNADPHSLVQALAQSELAVETAVVVRDKVVEAYQEILRMPV